MPTLVILLLLVIPENGVGGKHPDIHSTLRYHRRGHIHNGDYARLIVPLPILETYNHGLLLEHSLSLFEELHSQSEESGSHWFVLPEFHRAEKAAFDLVTADSNGVSTKAYSAADWQTNMEEKYGLLDDNRVIIRTELAAIKAEVAEAMGLLDNLVDRFGYVPVNDSPSTERYSMAENLEAARQHLRTLNLSQFKQQNSAGKTLLYEGINKIISQPQVYFDSAEQKKEMHLRTKSTDGQLNFDALLHLHSTMAETPLTFEPWIGQVLSRVKRQAVAILAGLVGAVSSSFLSHLGWNSDYASKAEMAELLHSLKANEKRVYRQTEYVQKLHIIDEHIISRQKRFYKHLLKLSKKMYRLTILVDFQNDINLIKPLINQYRQKVTLLIDGVNAAAIGAFPADLIPLNTLKQSCQKLYEKSQNDGFDAVTPDLRVLLTTQTKVSIIDAHLVILIDVPLKNRIEALPALIQIPPKQVLVQNGIQYRLNLKSEFFQLKLKEKLYQKMPNLEISRCKVYDAQYKKGTDPEQIILNSENDKIYFCPNQNNIEKKIFLKDYANSCIGNILLNKTQNILKFCPFKLQPIAKEIVIRHPGNFFHIYSGADQKKAMFCHMSNHAYEPKPKYHLYSSFGGKSLALEIPQNCKLVTDQHTVYGQNAPGSHMITVKPNLMQFHEEEIFSTIKLIMQSQIINEREFLEKVKILYNASQYENDLEKLKSIVSPAKEEYSELPPFYEHPYTKLLQFIGICLLSSLMILFTCYFIKNRMPRACGSLKDRIWQEGSRKLQRMRQWRTNQEAPEASNATDPSTRETGEIVPFVQNHEDCCMQCRQQIANLQTSLRNAFLKLNALETKINE